MESTGVYWISVYEVLGARGFHVYMVNAHHLKQVPGRQSDAKDCQWIQRLHTGGLLHGAFRPEAEMCAWRAYLRHRASLIEYRAAPRRECAAEITRQFQAIKPGWPTDLPPLTPEDKRDSPSKNAPAYDARTLLYQPTGVDVAAIPGLHASTGQTLLSEIGLDMRKWPTAKA